jgi:hypothetical protein
MISCEKCEAPTSIVLVVDVPDYIHDPVAGWFMCEECFAKDPDGWYEVLEAKQFDDVPAASKPEPEPAQATPGKRADDELVAWAYELHRGGMKLSDVAREAMKVRPYKSHASAKESLRLCWKKRGWPMNKAVAA